MPEATLNQVERACRRVRQGYEPATDSQPTKLRGLLSREAAISGDMSVFTVKNRRAGYCQEYAQGAGSAAVNKRNACVCVQHFPFV